MFIPEPNLDASMPPALRPRNTWTHVGDLAENATRSLVDKGQ
jgi:hypothetical protein